MDIKQHTTKKKLVIEYKEEEGEIFEKCCSKCLKWLSIDDFPNLKGSFLNKHNHCHACEAERAISIRRASGIKAKQPQVFIENGIASRACSKCHYCKPLTSYDKNPTGFLGHDSECSECKRRAGELYRRNKGIKAPRKIPILTDSAGVPTHRTCSRCQKMSPLTLFAKHTGKAFLGVHPYCKSCAAERHLISKYGLTASDKLEMYQRQNETCAICNIKIPLDKIHVDHCHTTGKIRGLLCSACNKALGLLKDDPTRCLNMATYLGNSSCVADKYTK